MGLHKGLTIEEFWAKKHLGEPLHPEISDHINKSRWQQIVRIFHIADLEDIEGDVPFEKLVSLNNNLRKRFKMSWIPGTHLAVDKTIQRFMERSRELLTSLLSLLPRASRYRS